MPRRILTNISATCVKTKTGAECSRFHLLPNPAAPFFPQTKSQLTNAKLASALDISAGGGVGVGVAAGVGSVAGVGSLDGEGSAAGVGVGAGGGFTGAVEVDGRVLCDGLGGAVSLPTALRTAATKGSAA